MTDNYMCEFYDIFTSTTYHTFIRKNREIKFLKEDTDYDGKWVIDFMGNKVLLLVRGATNEIYGLKSDEDSSPFLVLYLLIKRENALIGLANEPVLHHAPFKNILDYANEFRKMYKDYTACFLAFVKNNDECQEWIKILPEFYWINHELSPD